VVKSKKKQGKKEKGVKKINKKKKRINHVLDAESKV
jgi:hypothetical protein